VTGADGSAEFIVITGLSGAGRSQAANHLEDLGWFVVDNLPPILIPKVVELATAPGSSIDRVALVVGAGRYHADLVPALAKLRETSCRVRVMFLTAPTEVLVRRYEDTRRRHPLTDGHEGGLADAIERERALLEVVRAEADVVVDTAELTVHDLRDRIRELFDDGVADGLMRTTVQSFGYKHGLPRDVDMVLDCRFLPNPHWIDELRPLTGCDEPVRDFVLSRPAGREFLRRLDLLLDLLLPAYVQEGKSYLTIAFGCTGGRHRSVAIAEEVARRLRARGVEPIVHHRDIER
jgi:UPF0042 nucleotide-binding protein